MRILIVALLMSIGSNALAQLPNEDYRGVVRTGLALRKLATTHRVLVIGAHPDDEDTQLLSTLSLRDGADVAYLSLTRGEGGQNSIGGELGTALGLLRTGELLAARELDRGQQFFTRAYDFGFSKTADETLQHWPKDSILSDIVAIVRRYRPDVIVAIFTGTPRDGHGQHQVSGMLAREAFGAAADPARFPEQIRAGLRAHRTAKLFQATGYRQADPTQRFNTGELDPLVGRSYAQIAAASRSRHRSQDMGQAQALGPRSTSVRLLESTIPLTGDSTIFAGIKSTLSERARAARENAAVVSALQRYDSLVAAARGALSAYNTSRPAVMLAAALRELTGTLNGLRDADLVFAVLNELTTAQRAFLQASGVVLDAVSDAEVIVPGSTFTIDVSAWNGGDATIRVGQLQPVVPRSWRMERVDTAPDVVAPGAVVTRRFRVFVSVSAAPSQPYFLVQPRSGDYYAWPSLRADAGLPFQSPPVLIVAVIDAQGTQVQDQIVPTRRLVDPRQGEFRRSIFVAPAFAVRADPATAVITLSALASAAKKSIDANTEIVSNGRGGTVTVKPQLPAGWRARPEQVTLVLSGPGQMGAAHFAIEPPRAVGAGRYPVRFVVSDSTGRTYDMTERRVDYPHISNLVMYEPAVLNVTVLDAKFARALRVGYVVGVDASVPQVLGQLGMSVDLLDEAALANADLRKYDAIVIGSRAYEIRPDLIAHNRNLLDYARAGGNLLVLYQQYEFIDGKFAPYALTIARPHDRITDENAPVRLLDTTAIALTRPNRIASSDFVDWVQERALYMPRTWAAEYQPLLEMNDLGEAAQRGAILTAPLGAGHYTYTGLSFFREIPAGVPGAIRLFINLLSLGVKDAAF